ncbi:hypothetical protein [Streptomyces sp. AC154]
MSLANVFGPVFDPLRQPLAMAPGTPAGPRDRRRGLTVRQREFTEAPA